MCTCRAEVSTSWIRSAAEPHAVFNQQVNRYPTNHVNKYRGTVRCMVRLYRGRYRRTFARAAGGDACHSPVCLCEIYMINRTGCVLLREIFAQNEESSDGCRKKHCECKRYPPQRPALTQHTHARLNVIRSMLRDETAVCLCTYLENLETVLHRVGRSGLVRVANSSAFTLFRRCYM